MLLIPTIRPRNSNFLLGQIYSQKMLFEKVQTVMLLCVVCCGISSQDLSQKSRRSLSCFMTLEETCEAMSTLTLYPYQQECLEHSMAKNTICSLPTGYGKTLIAAKLIEHYLREAPRQRVAFLVPTRPLVEQQAEYCKRHCRLPNGSFPSIAKLVGQDQAGWQQSDWDDCLRRNHILLGTAALFQLALVTEKRISIEQVSLIVFDECHNATGNSPMAAVMRDAVAPYKAATGLPGPRILGLTASFVNGNMRDIDKKRRSIEALLLSTIYCPTVEERIGDDRFLPVSWAKTKNEGEHRQAVEEHVETALQVMGNIKDVNKVVKRCAHVFDELGYEALMHYIDKVIVEQIVAKAALLKQQGNDAATRCAAGMLSGLPSLQRELANLHLKLASDPHLQGSGKKSLKIEALVDCFAACFMVHASPTGASFSLNRWLSFPP
jgi:DEAD/DEAH box helicase